MFSVRIAEFIQQFAVINIDHLYVGPLLLSAALALCVLAPKLNPLASDSIRSE